MSKIIVCTRCDKKVWLEVGYDGYTGQCNCSHFSMSPGGDEPYCWERFDDLTDLDKFKVSGGDWSDEAEGFVGNEAICLKCKDGENTSVEFEEIDGINGHTVKATFRCTEDHFFNDREIESVAYYDPDHSIGLGDFPPAEFQDDE